MSGEPFRQFAGLDDAVADNVCQRNFSGGDEVKFRLEFLYFSQNFGVFRTIPINQVCHGF